VRRVGPGLAFVAVAVVLAFLFGEVVDVSPLVGGVVLGVIVANVGLTRPILTPGITFATKRLLRAGVVVLGLRLSFDQVRDLGVVGALAVVAVVVASFFGIQLLARLMGVSPGLGLLVATGYSICGASAVAAMEPLADADEEEVAYAIGLVTLCGSLSIIVLPAVGHAIGLSAEQFGGWAGAGVHDVGQVTATASAYAEESLAPALLVKLTRVILLAPLVAGVGLWRRRQHAATGGKVAFLFGNEKTGLSEADHAWATLHVRIPMAADQPSVNLAQAAQILAYELFVEALAERTRQGTPVSLDALDDDSGS